MGYKEEFINIYNENIKRSGSKELLDWMMKTDFFTAPASSKFHCACEQGLVMHSLSVYHTLVEKHFEPDKDSPESGMYYLFLCVLSCTERFTEALVVYNLTLTEKTDRITHIGIIGKSQNIVIGGAGFLLGSHILIYIRKNIAL